MHSHIPRCFSDCSCLDEFAALLQLQQTHMGQNLGLLVFFILIKKIKANIFFLKPQDKLLGLLLI